MPVMQKGRYARPVHMIKLTATQEITPYKWFIRRGEVTSHHGVGRERCAGSLLAHAHARPVSRLCAAS
jgi:hypothetical protein